MSIVVIGLAASAGTAADDDDDHGRVVAVVVIYAFVRSFLELAPRAF